MPEKRETLASKLDAYLARVNAQFPTVNRNYDPKKEAVSSRNRKSGRGK